MEAPFHGDPPPPASRGSTDGLWNHEVVEVMLLGDDDRYLEVELGPHGHYLVLVLEGRRNAVHQGLLIHHDAHIEGNRWTCRARAPHA